MDDNLKVRYIHFCNMDGKFSSLTTFVRSSLLKDTLGQDNVFKKKTFTKRKSLFSP
jgi:hypothetical protein